MAAAAAAESGSTSAGTGTKGTSKPGRQSTWQEHASGHAANGAAGGRARRSTSTGAGIADDVAEDAATAEAERAAPIGPPMSLDDRIDDVCGRMAAGQTVDKDTIAALLNDSGLSREDLDIRIGVARGEIEAADRRAKAAMLTAAQDGADDVLSGAHDRAALLRKQADAIEADAKAKAVALVSEFADEAKKAEEAGTSVTDAVVTAAHDRWMAAKTASQHAQKRLRDGKRLLEENDRLARGHMQRCSQEYMRLKERLETARKGK
jgi:hypothetical protein